MAESGRVRGSGRKASEEEAEAKSKADQQPLDPTGESEDLTSPPGPAHIGHDLFSTPGFARMRTEWRGPEGSVVRSALRSVDDKLVETFADAYALMHEVFEVVRQPEVNADGEMVVDRFGFPVWKRTAAGGWVEDWSQLTPRQRENFLFQITTRLFDWEQRAADIWGEAMFARVQWEEQFSIKFDAPMSGTEADRTAVGRTGSIDERYFAVFVSLYSRKADGLVRTMALLGQRLKDALIG